MRAETKEENDKIKKKQKKKTIIRAWTEIMEKKK